MPKNTIILKIAKVVFIICLIIFLLKEKSLYALNIIRNLIVNNILIVIIIIIIVLVWKTSQGGKK